MLYPAIRPYATRRLQVDGRHELHVEECGNPEGLPVVFLHGGPGAGCEDWHRQFFDPENYRIVLFDQRGAGRSTPHADLTDNTTAHLVEDIEKIREELDIKKWLVFGGSWGSTLGLAYAETHPERVLGMILRGIFLCRREDLTWFYQSGADRLFPDYWQDFIEPIPEEERGDMMAAYHRRLTGTDELIRMKAAKAWSIWEGRCSNLQHSAKVIETFSDPHVALSLARIECHYFVNQIFMEEGQLLAEADRLEKIPGILVHGRYDVVCPIDQAFALQRAWPGARLDLAAEAGHSALEQGITTALIAATQEMHELLTRV